MNEKKIYNYIILYFFILENIHFPHFMRKYKKINIE